MRNSLDRIIARAGREGTFLRPRVGHRFGPPEHHIAASDDPLEGRDGGDGVPPEGEPARSTDGPENPLTLRSESPFSAGEVGRSPGGRAGAETEGASWSSTQTGGARRGEVGSAAERLGAPALSSLAAEPTAEFPRGPAAASASVPTSDSPAQRGQDRQATQDSFVERLRARLREAHTAPAAGASEHGDPVVAPTSPGGGPLDAAVIGTAEVKSRSARNEDAFWRFLYGPGAEAPAIQKRSAEEGRTGASVEASAATGSSSRLRGGAAAAGPTTTGASAPARPTTMAVGRIDVRVQAPPVAPRPAAVPKRHPPRLGLADYMRQSASGDRRR